MTTGISTHKTFAEQRREEKREENDIYLYIRSLQDKQTTIPKTGVFLRINPGLHEASKLLAPLFHTTVSNLYAEALVKHLERLAASLPSTVQLNIIHRIQTKPDSSMLDLEVDLVREELLSVIERIRKLKPTAAWKDSSQKRFLLERLRKQLSRSIRLAQRSGNEAFQNLVLEARELLRGEA
jgi:hypothetical protein